MDKDFFNMPGYNMPPFYGYDVNTDPNMQNNMDNSMFNPLMQYEQAYMYYRYLSMQMEYKIKCKEYEKLSNNNDVSRNNARKVE